MPKINGKLPEITNHPNVFCYVPDHNEVPTLQLSDGMMVMVMMVMVWYDGYG